MRLLKQLGTTIFWFTVWTAIPALLLYPLVRWAVNHTQISPYKLAQSYVMAIGLLFLPSGFLVDYIYRRFIRDRLSKNRA